MSPRSRYVSVDLYARSRQRETPVGGVEPALDPSICSPAEVVGGESETRSHPDLKGSFEPRPLVNVPASSTIARHRRDRARVHAARARGADRPRVAAGFGPVRGRCLARSVVVFLSTMREGDPCRPHSPAASHR
jgi:hypothetical protein